MLSKGGIDDKVVEHGAVAVNFVGKWRHFVSVVKLVEQKNGAKGHGNTAHEQLKAEGVVLAAHVVAHNVLGAPGGTRVVFRGRGGRSSRLYKVFFPKGVNVSGEVGEPRG